MTVSGQPREFSGRTRESLEATPGFWRLDIITTSESFCQFIEEETVSGWGAIKVGYETWHPEQRPELVEG
jgi:hypothetical protein